MSAPEDLVAEARAAREQAYAPYSKFAVGASLRGASGRLYSGCNVENAAYPQGWCAEASAIAAMVRAGERRIVEVVIMGEGPPPCTPCGGCRQKILEFAAPEVEVHVCSPDRWLMTTTVAQLMPHAFGPANLAKSEGEEH